MTLFPQVERIPNTWDASCFHLPRGHAIGEPEPLFMTISAAKPGEWREAFRGRDAETVGEEGVEGGEGSCERESKREKTKKKANSQNYLFEIHFPLGSSSLDLLNGSGMTFTRTASDGCRISRLSLRS